MNTYQDYDWPSTKKIYLGKSGSGKTSLFWEHWQKEPARFKFIYDHKAMEFSRRYKIQPVFTKEEILKELKKGSGTICFSPMRMFPGEAERGFEVFCNFIFQISEHIKGRKLFGCDELQRMVGTNARPKPLLQICDIGRTFQIDCFFIASSSNAIHNLVLNQITEAYCFQHGTNNGCQWEEDNGFDAYELTTLKRGEWRWRNLNTGDFCHGGAAF